MAEAHQELARAQQEVPQETAVAQAAAVAEAQQVAAQAVAEDRAAVVAAGYQESFQTQQEAAQAAAVDGRHPRSRCSTAKRLGKAA